MFWKLVSFQVTMILNHSFFFLFILFIKSLAPFFFFHLCHLVIFFVLNAGGAFYFSGLFCLFAFGERILCITQVEASNFSPSWFIPQLLEWKMWGTIPVCYFVIQINEQDDYHIFRPFWSHRFGLHMHLLSFAFHYTHLIETISFWHLTFHLHLS